MSAARSAVLNKSGVAPKIDIYIDLVKRSTNIREIVREHVALKKSGLHRYVGFCPFHTERTPSFTVFVAEQCFHCFGCQSRGDVFTFVQQINGLGFRFAFRYLANRCGITPDRDAFKEKAFQSRADIAETGLFITGLTWSIERYLSLLKELWLLDDSAPECPRIQSFTNLLTQFQEWSPSDATRFFKRYQKLAPEFVKQCVSEADETHRILATVLAAAGTAGPA